MYVGHNNFGSHRSYSGKIKLYDISENNIYNCFQVYFGGRIKYERKTIHDNELDKAKEILLRDGKRFYVHACLSSHLASDSIVKRTGRPVHEHTREALEHELEYIQHLPASSVIHPGSKGSCETFSERLNDIGIPSSLNSKTLLLENSAGQGTSIGVTLDEFRTIFEGLDNTSNISVCIDTCHAYASGLCLFDSADEVDNLFDNFYNLLGHHIPMIHMNGSRIASCVSKPCRKDKHANLLFNGTVMVERKRKGKKVLVEEDITDYIWKHPNYNRLCSVILNSINSMDLRLEHVYEEVKRCDNFESLERLIEWTKDSNIDMISETGTSVLINEGVDVDHAIVSSIFNKL